MLRAAEGASGAGSPKREGQTPTPHVNNHTHLLGPTIPSLTAFIGLSPGKQLRQGLMMKIGITAQNNSITDTDPSL